MIGRKRKLNQSLFLSDMIQVPTADALRVPKVKQQYRLELKAELKGHTDRVWSVAWSPNGQTLVSTSGDKSIRVWNRRQQTGETKEGWDLVAKLEGVHTRTVRTVAWSPSGKQFASAGFDGVIGIWRRDEDGEWDCVAQLEGQENEIKCVAWNASGQLLASCSRDKTVWIWDCSDPDGDIDCLSVLHGHAQDVKAVVWHPFDDLLFSLSYDNTIKVWQEEGDDWYCTDTLSEHKSTVWSGAFRADGNRFVSVGDDLSMTLYERTGTPQDEKQWVVTSSRENAHSRTIFCVDWEKADDAKQSRVVTCGADDAIRMWNLADDTSTLLAEEPSAHSSDVNCVAWHPHSGTNGILASSGDDMLVKIWQVVLNE